MSESVLAWADRNRTIIRVDGNANGTLFFDEPALEAVEHVVAPIERVGSKHSQCMAIRPPRRSGSHGGQASTVPTQMTGEGPRSSNRNPPPS